MGGLLLPHIPGMDFAASCCSLLWDWGTLEPCAPCLLVFPKAAYLIVPVERSLPFLAAGWQCGRSAWVFCWPWTSLPLSQSVLESWVQGAWEQVCWPSPIPLGLKHTIHRYSDEICELTSGREIFSWSELRGECGMVCTAVWELGTPPFTDQTGKSIAWEPHFVPLSMDSFSLGHLHDLNAIC